MDKNIINEKFDILIKEYDNELKEREILLCNYEQQIKGIENKLSILYKDRLDGIISADKYKMIS